MKYEKWVVEIVAKHYESSLSEAREYLDVFYATEQNKANLKTILQKYGSDPKEIQETKSTLMTRVNYETLGKFIDIDEKDLEFERVTNSIDVVDREYGVEVIFDYYRRHGFPHYKIREDEKHEHMRKLKKFDVDTIFIDNQIVQTMHCLRLAWSYFPFFWEVQCGHSRTSPMQAFNDDKIFKSVITKCWNWEQKHYKGEDPKGERNKFHENRLRQSLKLYSGVQAVSNFRPTAAKVIYEKFGGDGVIWDMSCGWGGRLLGFLSSSNTKHYIGTEPSTRTYNGLLQMSEEFSYIKKKVDIYKQGSEDFIPNKSSLDFVLLHHLISTRKSIPMSPHKVILNSHQVMNG